MKRIVVTGANKGIGRAIVAAILDAHPDAFVFLGARSPERGQAAVDALIAEDGSRDGRLALLTIDVSRDDSVQAAAAAVDGPLYGVVNNAGIGTGAPHEVVAVNTFGVRRVCEAFLPKLVDGGRIVNVTSASGPNFVADCPPAQQARLLDPDITWPDLSAVIDDYLAAPARFCRRGPYGFSKAAANAYTQLLAREHPRLTVNACTPGFIETDMTRRYAIAQQRTPAEMGMKSPAEGARSTMFLLFGTPQGSGHYYGSDAERSPLDRYRAPGSAPYRG